MRIVTFQHNDFVRAGVVERDHARQENRVLDLAHEQVRSLLDGAEPQLYALLDFGTKSLIEALDGAVLPDSCWLSMSEVCLMAPLPVPRRIFAAALNYRDALTERGMPQPDEPIIFHKDPKTVTGPGDTVSFPVSIGGVTWEVELAAVIGSSLSSASAEASLAAVAGYFIFNDISASEIIRADGNFDRGKNFPTFGPSGPVLVTADEIPDPQDLKIRLTLNGQVMQDSSTSQMLFGVGDLISRLSRTYDLECGDVIATGTPAGVGPMHNPPRWLKSGDIMIAQVEGLGRLANTVWQEGTNV